MSSCPPEFAAQVDAVQHGPFSARDAPLGTWFKNNQGNICLTLPDESYYYFNTKGDWYTLQREPNKPDRDCASIYVTPPGVRYYNPSSDHRQGASSFVGVHWRTEVEKVCWRDEYGMLSFTFRKLVDPADLPNLQRKYIAVFINQAGTQRVVEVNELGVYTGNTPWVLEEIEYWLANLVAVDDVDGPEWRGAEARPLTPPAEQRARRASVHRDVRGSSSPSSSPSIKEEEQGDLERVREVSSHSSDSRDSSPSVKMEESEEETGYVSEESYDGENDEGNEEDILDDDYSFDMGEDDMGREEHVEEDACEREEELVEPDDIPVASGSGQACMRNLLAARRPEATPVVQGSRISKNTKGKSSRGGSKLLRN